MLMQLKQKLKPYYQAFIEWKDLELELQKQRTIEIEGVKIYLGHHLSKSILKTLKKGVYEENEISILRKILTPNDVVMELGGGLGFLSSFCAKIIGSERVFVYEANPLLKKPIYNTYKLNEVSPNLNLLLLGEENGHETFYVNKNFWSSSTLANEPQAKAITIPKKSFNDEIKKVNPTLLIIDIEGGEYDLVQYADFYQTKKILIELHKQFIGAEKIAFVKEKFSQAGFVINPDYSQGKVYLLER